jgi:hypothetical protein
MGRIMKMFLKDFFQTLSTRQQEKVSAVLEEAKVSKEELPSLAKKLSQMQKSIPLFLSRETPGTLIKNTGFFVNLRDTHTRVQEIYDTSNYISVLLDSNQQVLLSEVKAIEDELIALEKVSRNYGFLLSDSGVFDFAYLETFSDDRGRDPMETVPDRAAQVFGPAEMGTISSDGNLVLPQNLTVSHGLTASIVGGNVAALLTNRDVSKLAGNSNANGWRASIDSVSPITTSVPEAGDRTGAQVVIEFRTAQPSPSSEIKINPFADTDVELVQVITYPGESEEGATSLLESYVTLDRPYTLHFPMTNILRFKIVLNQPTYNRVSQFATVEDEYRQGFEALQQRLKDIKDAVLVDRLPTYARVRAMVDWLSRKGKFRLRPGRSGGGGFSALPFFYDIEYRGPVSSIELPRISNNIGSILPIFGRRRLGGRFSVDDIMLRVFKNKDSLYEYLTSREVSGFTEFLKTKGLYDASGSVTTPLINLYNQAFVYRYAFGLFHVSLGVQSIGHKGFFVSKPFPSDGDFGEVRLKTSQQNYSVPNTDLDNTLLTSVEYSVSNKTDPSNEDDWIPIQPVGETEIGSERLFPSETGLSYFRFTADGSAAIDIFKNGYSLQITSLNYLYNSSKQGVTGIRLPDRTYTTEDILTVKYTPMTDHSTISFETEGFDVAPLVSVYDADGPGEKFASTYGRNEVELSHYPYIDQAQVDTSVYTTTIGLTPYSPIVVTLDDGTLAINLTNYKAGDPETLPDTGYYYYHSGTTLIFNQAITDPFTVAYQYLENNVRVRVVLRCNSRNFVSPKVDFFHIKAKTRRPIKENLS